MKINFNKQKLTNLYNQLKQEAKPYIEQASEKLDEYVAEAKPVAKKLKEKAAESIEDVSKKTNPILDKIKQKALQILYPSTTEKLKQKINRKSKLLVFHEIQLAFLKKNSPEAVEKIQKATERQEIRKQKLQLLIDEHNAFYKKQSAAQNASDILNGPKKLNY